MKYANLPLAIDAFNKGENVTGVLREAFGAPNNTDQIIEIAYDLQAGEYVQITLENKEKWMAYTEELASILSRHVSEGDKVLDVGTGEMTTLVGVMNQLNMDTLNWFAFDISWSRINKGKTFSENYLEGKRANKINAFVASLFNIPLASDSMDVVLSVHALEPNGGRERDMVKALFRVARKKLILFEPSFKKNSTEGKKRMCQLGYITELSKAIEEAGGTINELVAITNVKNPLNPTYAYVITPPRNENTSNQGVWSCPTTGQPMIEQADYFLNPYSGLVYPIIMGVPILRSEAAVLATALKSGKSAP